MRAAICLGLALGALGCDRLVSQARALQHAPVAATATTPHVEASAAPSAEGHTPPSTAEEGNLKYGLPFAWEVSRDEPLSKTRTFLKEALLDNQKQVDRGSSAFRPFADKQSPRATVVTCADSRVQSQAWDATPENDDFVIRNIGNQIANSHGSVMYGVEHLGTPLLLVIGHTGCGAVKAAMGKLDSLEEPIRHELEELHLPPAAAGASENKRWADAVIANVNQQVAFAVEHLGKRIREGQLTVVGAVYDFRNDLRGGAGKLHVVNVNANTEADRLKAFSKAVLDWTPPPEAPGKARLGASHKAPARAGNGVGLAELLGGKSPLVPAE